MQTVKLIIALLWVGIPLGWGLYQSVQKSKPLFLGEPSAAAAAPAK